MKRHVRTYQRIEVPIQWLTEREPFFWFPQREAKSLLARRLHTKHLFLLSVAKNILQVI